MMKNVPKTALILFGLNDRSMTMMYPRLLLVIVALWIWESQARVSDFCKILQTFDLQSRSLALQGIQSEVT